MEFEFYNAGEKKCVDRSYNIKIFFYSMADLLAFLEISLKQKNSTFFLDFFHPNGFTHSL